MQTAQSPAELVLSEEQEARLEQLDDRWRVVGVSDSGGVLVRDDDEKIMQVTRRGRFTPASRSALDCLAGRRIDRYLPLVHDHEFGAWQEDIAGSVRECGICSYVEFRPEG